MKTQIRLAALGILLGLGACSSLPGTEATLYSPTPATMIADGRVAPPPGGFVSFCMHNLSVCAGSQDGVGSVVTLDDPTRAMLIEVNDRINASIAFQSDFKTYGVANHWNLNAVGSVGDCKDYALAKQQALIAAGLPKDALRMAIVRTRNNELHAVLTVDTNMGDYVLDSINPAILAWSATEYSWLSRQSAHNPMQWVAVAQNF